MLKIKDKCHPCNKRDEEMYTRYNSVTLSLFHFIIMYTNMKTMHMRFIYKIYHEVRNVQTYFDDDSFNE